MKLLRRIFDGRFRFGLIKLIVEYHYIYFWVGLLSGMQMCVYFRLVHFRLASEIFIITVIGMKWRSSVEIRYTEKYEMNTNRNAFLYLAWIQHKISFSSSFCSILGLENPSFPSVCYIRRLVSLLLHPYIFPFPFILILTMTAAILLALDMKRSSISRRNQHIKWKER